MIQEMAKKAKRLEAAMQEFADDFYRLEDNTDRGALTAEDSYLFNRLYELAEAAEKFSSTTKYMNKPVKVEGTLYKNPNERLEVEGYELTAGHPIELWIEDDYYDVGGYWAPTRIEHATDYYAVGFDSESLEGRLVRIK